MTTDNFAPVGNRIRALRESLPCAACRKPAGAHPHGKCRRFVVMDLARAAARVGVSRETLRKIESGETIKISTLKQIATGLGASRPDVIELVCTWLRCHAGDEIEAIDITPRTKPSALQAAGQSATDRLTRAAAALTTREQEILLAAINRPEVLRSIAHLNSLWDAAAEGAGTGTQPGTRRRNA